MASRLLIKNLENIYSPDVPTFPPDPLDILIDGTDIAEIGGNLKSEGARIVDGRGCVAIPGLVNTHHHFYQVLTRAIPRMQNSELFPWLVDHYRVWEGIDAECVYWSSLAAMCELILTGCTTTADHHYLFPVHTSPELIDAQFEAAGKAGLRFLATRGSMSVGKNKGGLPPDTVIQEETTILEDSLRVIDKYHDASPRAMRRIALAPCSPFSVSQDLMRQSACLARDKNVRLHTHLAETLDEEEYCLNQFNCRPVEFMEQLDWIGSDVWFAHCVHMNPREIDLFATTGTGVAHCPSSNMRLGSGIAPIRELLAAGAPVGLAVDGSASNDSSNMMSEVRQALFLQRVTKGARAMQVNQAIDIATQGGAHILGFEEMGVLGKGRPADIALFRVDGLDFAGVHDSIAGLLLTGNCSRADSVIINGNLIVEKARFLNLSIDEITRKTNQLAANLLRTAESRTGINYRIQRS